MADKTRTKCGLNGRKNDFVNKWQFITYCKTRACDCLISSVISLIGHFVRKNDRVSFRDFNPGRFYFYSFKLDSTGSKILKLIC